MRESGEAVEESSALAVISSATPRLVLRVVIATVQEWGT